MPAALRCPKSRCGIDWPLSGKYQPCPSCEKHCIPIGIGDPLPEAQAHTMMCWMKFERHCAKLDAEREAEFARIVDGVELKEPVPGEEPVQSD